MVLLQIRVNWGKLMHIRRVHNSEAEAAQAGYPSFV